MSESQALYDLGEFFAPASADVVDGLVGEYKKMRRRIEEFAETFEQAELSPVLGYFFSGNMDRSDRVPALTKVMQAPGAIAALNSEYWSRALSLTDVYESMPQKRRDEWNDQIREHKTPDFEEETVRATLENLLASRGKFFAERVDGMFRALSGEHVTNRPEGFSKRMIMYVIDSVGLVDYSKAGHLTDLRKVIAKFMGRDEPDESTTRAIIDAGRRNTGEWLSVDAGAMRIRVYMKGTAHLEINPEMAWKLNQILASIYPNAIPSSFRTKPKRKLKEFKLMDRPLPFAVLSALASAKEAINWEGEHYNRRATRIPNTREISRSADKHTKKEAEKVLEAIGGVKADGHHQFDYDPTSVIDEIVCSGCIPDHKSHQFYPTPEGIARDAVALAGIGSQHNCLEPSAGVGGLADMMCEYRCQEITCVEISPIHCAVLEAKGYYTIQVDFMQWAADTGERFDRIVMNPPYSEGRWKAHTEAAASLLAPGGRLVAVLPASAKGKFDIEGLSCSYSKTYRNEFAGTSIDTVILIADKAG